MSVRCDRFEISNKPKRTTKWKSSSSLGQSLNSFCSSSPFSKKRTKQNGNLNRNLHLLLLWCSCVRHRLRILRHCVCWLPQPLWLRVTCHTSPLECKQQRKEKEKEKCSNMKILEMNTTLQFVCVAKTKLLGAIAITSKTSYPQHTLPCV